MKSSSKSKRAEKRPPTGTAGKPSSSGPGLKKLFKRLRTCRTAVESAHGRYRDTLYESAADVFGVGLELRTDPALFAAFVKSPKWKDHKGRRPEPGDVAHAITHATMFTLAGHTRAANQRASVIACALEHLAARKVKVEAVADELRRPRGPRGESGFRYLAQEAARERRGEPGEVKKPGIKTSSASSQSLRSPDDKRTSIAVLASKSIAASLAGRKLFIVAKMGTARLSAKRTKLKPVKLDLSGLSDPAKREADGSPDGVVRKKIEAAAVTKTARRKLRPGRDTHKRSFGMMPAWTATKRPAGDL